MTEKFIDLEQASEGEEEDLIQNMDRPLDEMVEEDLDMQLDREQQIDNEQFHNELLFNVQQLGEQAELDGIQFYKKGKRCKEALQSLIKFVKNDDPENMTTRLILGKWNIVQSDLLELLISQAQDRLLSYYIVTLLLLLTEAPDQECKNTVQIWQILRNYKQNFLKNKVLETLMINLQDCLISENKNKAQINMIGIILGLFKNLLQVPDGTQDCGPSNEIQKKLQFNFIIAMIKEDTIEALIYLAQDTSQEYTYIMEYIEIFYHIFSCFDPKWLSSLEDKNNRIQNLIEEERKKREMTLNLTGTKRHSKFESNYVFKRRFDNSLKYVSNPNMLKDQVINISNNQLKKPIKRKIYFEHQSIFRKQIKEDCYIKDDEQENGEIKEVYLRETVNYYAQAFIAQSFSHLMEQAYNEIEKFGNEEKIKDEYVVHYFVLLSFALKFVREQFYTDKKLGKVQTLNASPVYVCLELTQFELMQRYLFQESTKTKKRTFNYRIFQSTLLSLLELLKFVKEMGKDSDATNRQNSKIILTQIFSVQINKFLLAGFDYSLQGILDDFQLKLVAETTGLYYELVEYHYKGKMFRITTNKQIKKKKAKAKAKKSKKYIDEEDELRDFIEQEKNQQENEDADYNPDQENQNNNNQEKEINNQQKEDNNQINEIKNETDDENNEKNAEDDDDEEEEEEERVQFKEIDTNINAIFVELITYKNISKLLYLIKGEKILSNSESLNVAIFSIIKRIAINLKADYIFYQIEYMNIFQQILGNFQITSKTEVKQNLVFVLKRIIKNYFILLKKNSFLIVESFFRFNSYDLVQEIKSNYENISNTNQNENDEYNENLGAFQQNDDESEDDYHIGKTGYKKKWCLGEDQALLNNYEIFESEDNCFEKLENLLQNLNYFGKNQDDIRKRVRKLKLDKSKELAQEEVRKIYEQKMTLQQSIRSLRRNKNKLGDIQQNDIQEYLTVIFTNYIDFLKTYPPDQIQGGNNQKGLGLGADFAIVPIFKIQFDMFENEYFLQILDTLDIRPPTQGEWLWRIPTFIREVDAQLYIEKIKKYFEEEIDIEEEIKNQSKLKNNKELKQNNNNSLQNYDSDINIDGEGDYINQQEKMLEELENTQINKIRKMNQSKKMEEELEIQKLDKIYNQEHDDEKFKEFKESISNSKQPNLKNQQKQFISQQNSQNQKAGSQKQSQFMQTQQQEIDQMFSSNENSRQF